MDELEVTFRGWKCRIEVAQYANGRPALRLFDAETWEPIATATLNLPEVEIAAGHVAVKDYSENEGMLDALMGAGVVRPTGMVVDIDAMGLTVPICELLIPVPDHVPDGGMRH